MRDLNYDLKQLCHRNRDGSFATQANRARILTLVANQLHEAGFRHLTAANLKAKHIQALIERWKADELSPGTIKNRMAEIRWVLEKTGRQNVAARGNDAYGIPHRKHVATINQARVLTEAELARVTDPLTRMSLRLQAAFGLRREESIKIDPVVADRGDRLILRDSWTKGGRAREIPIRTDAQREVLAQAKALVGARSLIEIGRTYAKQLRHFEYQCARAGIRHVHGHRHQYAQERYKALTGWASPIAGGPRSKELTPAQKAIDREARLTISQELGHGREAILAIYLAR